MSNQEGFLTKVAFQYSTVIFMVAVLCIAIGLAVSLSHDGPDLVKDRLGKSFTVEAYTGASSDVRNTVAVYFISIGALMLLIAGIRFGVELNIKAKAQRT